MKREKTLSKRNIDRNTRIERNLSYWQIFLGLSDWDLSVKLTKFHRKDSYNQSGDIKVNLKEKKATILLKDTETGKDSSIILHELLHLILWPFDSFSEKYIPQGKKDEYFGLLEDTVAKLEKILLGTDRNN